MNDSITGFRCRREYTVTVVDRRVTGSATLVWAKCDSSPGHHYAEPSAHIIVMSCGHMEVPNLRV